MTNRTLFAIILSACAIAIGLGILIGRLFLTPAQLHDVLVSAAKLTAQAYAFWTQVLQSLVVRVIVSAVALWAAFSLRTIFRFVRRLVQRTDELIAGRWYVYRYTRAGGEYVWLHDEWRIIRSLSRRYVVRMSPAVRETSRRSSGEVLYNERDRLNILYNGFDHKEQSLISFSPRIPVMGDSRMLGLGVGDDGDYVLSTRVYLASRRPLPEEHAKAVIEEAGRSIAGHDLGKVLQLPSSVILSVLAKHPMPKLAADADTRSGLLRFLPKR